MREILFRGKTVETKEWVFGFYNHCHWKGNKHTIRVQKDSHLEDHFIDPETVGQYTGLKDKNGTKIFEGDIFLLDNNGCYIVGVLRFCEETSKLVFDTYGLVKVWNGLCDEEHSGSLDTEDVDNYHLEDLDVIGNIHDNPELLEGK